MSCPIFPYGLSNVPKIHCNSMPVFDVLKIASQSELQKDVFSIYFYKDGNIYGRILNANDFLKGSYFDVTCIFEKDCYTLAMSENGMLKGMDSVKHENAILSGNERADIINKFVNSIIKTIN